MHVLVIEDDEACRDSLERLALKSGLEFTPASNAAVALRLLDDSRQGHFDLILLDVLMPGQSGWEFLETLRRQGDETPVILLTGLDSVEDRIKGLTLGADDYLAKPFDRRELLARIQAVMHRHSSVPTINLGELRLDVGSRSVFREDTRIELSPREFDVLLALAEVEGRTVSRSELLRRVWGLAFEPGTSVVEVQIARLRRRLEVVSSSSLIRTVVGEGYRLSMPEVLKTPSTP